MTFCSQSVCAFLRGMCGFSLSRQKSFFHSEIHEINMSETIDDLLLLPWKLHVRNVLCTKFPYGHSLLVISTIQTHIFLVAFYCISFYLFGIVCLASVFSRRLPFFSSGHFRWVCVWLAFDTSSTDPFKRNKITIVCLRLYTEITKFRNRKKNTSNASFRTSPPNAIHFKLSIFISYLMGRLKQIFPHFLCEMRWGFFLFAGRCCWTFLLAQVMMQVFIAHNQFYCKRFSNDKFFRAKTRPFRFVQPKWNKLNCNRIKTDCVHFITEIPSASIRNSCLGKLLYVSFGCWNGNTNSSRYVCESAFCLICDAIRRTSQDVF